MFFSGVKSPYVCFTKRSFDFITLILSIVIILQLFYPFLKITSVCLFVLKIRFVFYFHCCHDMVGYSCHQRTGLGEGRDLKYKCSINHVSLAFAKPTLAVRYFLFHFQCPQPSVTDFLILNNFCENKFVVLQYFCRCVMFGCSCCSNYHFWVGVLRNCN